jgi:hypothetical protein
MSNEFKFEVGLPLTKKDIKLIEICLEGKNVDIDSQILEAYFNAIKPIAVNEPEISLLEKPDYYKFIEKLKQLQFIEQYLHENKEIVEKFYSSLVKFLKAEKIPFSKNYETKGHYIVKIDSFVKDFLTKYMNESNTWLIRAYIVGRCLIKINLVKPEKEQELNNKYNFSNETIRLTKKHNLDLTSAMRINVALTYFTTTINFLQEEEIEKVRTIIIKELIIGNTPFYKLREIAFNNFPNEPMYLNIGWSNIFKNEYSLICHRATMELNQEKVFHIITHPNCCEECFKLVGKIFNVKTLPLFPYDKCTADICRCIPFPFNPESQFIESDGKIRLSIEDKKTWRLWYLNHFDIIWNDKCLKK